MQPKEPVDDWAAFPPKGAPSGKSVLLKSLKQAVVWTAIIFTALVLSFAVYCGFFGFHPAPIYGSYQPGWDAAYTGGMFFLFLGGPTYGLGIFVAALVVSLIRSGRSSS
jgi:hypothetical protein